MRKIEKNFAEFSEFAYLTNLRRDNTSQREGRGRPHIQHRGVVRQTEGQVAQTLYVAAHDAQLLPVTQVCAALVKMPEKYSPMLVKMPEKYSTMLVKMPEKIQHKACINA